MTRFLTVVALVLASGAVAAGQTNVEAAREELNRGAQHYRNGNYAEAQRHFERVVALDPSYRSGPTLVARSIMQQFKPGDSSPENVAKAREAVAAYEKIIADDPDHDEAFNAVLYLYRQTRDGEGEDRWLWRHANDAAAPARRRAVAYVILASKQWDCAYEITEANKKLFENGGEPSIRYVRPESQAEMDKARGCATEGLRLVGEAARLDASNPHAWSQKANLLREQSKLAEMDGDERLRDYYEREFGAASETYSRLNDEQRKRDAATRGAAPHGAGESRTVTTRTTSDPQSAVVSGGNLNGKAVSKPQPAYPSEARKAGARGVVNVLVVVDEAGRVVHAEAVTGHPLLHAAAVAAARRARFPQTLRQGQPVRVRGVVTYNFVLE